MLKQMNVRCVARTMTDWAAMAILVGAAQPSLAGPVDVSYTLSGSPGSYDLSFRVSNNMLATPTQNIYFFGVRLNVTNITGAPTNWFDNQASANWFNYGGSATEYNNTWRTPLNNGSPPYSPLPGALLPGTTVSGFIVHIPDLAPPTTVQWSAVSNGDEPYLGGGNFISNTNPGFEGIVAPGIPGDYNANGIVDAADYTLWRDNLGSLTALPNDDTPGVGPDDYTRWKTNFGQTAGSGAASGATDSAGAAVPEPSAARLATVLFLVAIAGPLLDRPRPLRSAR